MKIEKIIDPKTNSLSIKIDGSFDYSLLKDFRSTYCDNNQKYSHYSIDLRNCDVMDSSALGMMLNMKSSLGLEANQIKILNCRPMMKRILLIARFDKIFSIE